MRRLMACLVASLVLFGASACGEDDEPATDSVGTETERPDDQVEATEPMELSITAKDYSFDVPATIKAGLLDVTFTNAGKEPHFAGFAKAAPGKTFADVKAALTAPPSASPPSGPPPFIEHAGAPTADPGTGGKMMFSLEAGSYALFCLIPSPDGAPHAVKGMITEVTVTADGGESQAKAELPEAIGTVTATDFALNGTPKMKAGTNVVKLRNDGKQLHEINLVELPPGKKADDVVAWFRQPGGPPPHRSLSGVAVKPGDEGTAEIELKAGSTYAFVCVIPDVLGDFAPHIVKGMFTQPFTIS